MKKKIIALLLAAITIIHICVPALPVIAEGTDSANDDSSVVGSFVRFSSDDALVYMYKSVTSSGPSSDTKRITASALPDVYVVLEEITVSYGTQFYKLGTTDGSSNEILDTYPWVKAALMEIVPDPDAGLIKGQVDLTDGSTKLDVLTVTAGEREYVFTNLGSEVSEKATYSWQMLVDKKNNTWASIIDYCYPYAVVTEALILNSLDEDGAATMRCIVTDGHKKFVSNRIKISLERPVALLSEAVASNEIDTYAAPTPKMLRSTQRVATEAFQITIEYVYLHANAVDPSLNGSNAAKAITITLPPGTGFDHAIASPPLAGYKPYIEWKEGDSEEGLITYAGKQLIPAEEVKFNNQQEGIHVTVYYVPQTVNYRVKYYKQNLRNDEYIEWKTEFKTGIADTAVADDLAVAELGFSPLYYEKNTCITNDGNTVVEIYYDRIYYLVKYEIGEDAYGVTPNYVRYGTTLMLGNPTNPGYTFDGWQLTSVKDTTDGEELLTDANLTTTYQNYNKTDANSQITVAHNLVYTAKWTATDVSFAIVYWKENANDNGYSCWGVQTVTGNQPGDVVTVDGTNIPQSIHNGEKNYFTYNSVLSDTQVTVKGDGSAVANVYYYRNIYTLAFEVDGLCNIPEGHTHTDECYDYICNNGNHVHDENCVLICTIEEHRHNPIACGCDVTEHTHSAACCTIPTHVHGGADCVCKIQEHTHTTSCWNNVGNKSNDPSGTQPTNGLKDGLIYVYDGIFGWGRTRYIYIKGSWYEYSATANNGTVLSPDNCTLDEHTHGGADCGCDLTAHDHTSGCNIDNCPNGGNEHTHGDGHCNYTCGKTAHTHNASCYDCGEDLHEHVDACKRLICAIPLNHSHTGDCNSTSESSTVAMITGKYGSDIRDRFPLTGRDGADFAGYWWKVPSGSTFLTAGRSIVSLDQILGENLTFTGDPNTGDTRAVIYYYIEALPGAPYVEGLPNAGDKHYELYKEVVTVKVGYLTTEEEFHTIAGFTRGNYYPNNIFNSSVADENYLYYTRNSYALQFHSNNVHLTDLDKTVLYGASMSSYAAILPTYPTAFEPNAYTFAGWYTTPGCYDGTEFDFESETMPDHNVLLYAKWVPTSWNVEVYLDDGMDDQLYSDTLPFGSMIPEPDYKEAQLSRPDYKDLIWAGWYYKDAAGDEVRFDFNTMALKTNYNGTVDPVTSEQYPSAIYAKWTSEIPIAYTVYYVTEIDGNYVNVADPTEGVALAGINKSFIAKSGEDIYDEYKEYLPTDRSITHKMSVIADENVIYFEYITAQEIVYTVKHVFKSSNFNEILGTDTLELSWNYTVQTSDPSFSGRFMISFDAELYDHVVAQANGTALWEIIKDLSPDAYKQELILAIGEANEVVFYWENHGETFIYQVVHYFQKLDYSDFTGEDQYTAEYYQEFVGAYAGENSVTVNATPVERQGFTLNNGKSELSMVLYKTDEGIKERVLKVFYDRKTINYTVNHYYGGSNITANKTALYEEVVTEYAKTDILGYVIADPAQAEQNVSITYDGQMINFYYVAQKVIFNYQVIGNVGGYLSIPQETVSIGTPAIGATPMAAAGYIFIGWYTDADAATKVNDAWVDASGKLTPVASVADANKMITYYAKFAPNSLTIHNNFTSVSNNAGSALDLSEQGFIYTIQGKAGTPTEGVYIRVAVLSGGSQTILALPTGEYVVTLEHEWSWRYTTVREVSTTMADGTDSLNTSISNMSWTLNFTGSGEMQVVYEVPNTDVIGPTESDSYYYVTDNTYNY